MHNRKDKRGGSHAVSTVILTTVAGALLLSIGGVAIFDRQYTKKIYPGVSVGGVSFGGKAPQEVQSYWENKNEPFVGKQFEFRFEQDVATVSASDLNLGYDATLSATQAYLVGRSGHIGSDFLAKFALRPVNLTPYFRWNDDILDEALTTLAQRVDIPVQEALFDFSNGKVTTFKPSHSGRKMNKEETKQRFRQAVISLPQTNNQTLTITVPVDMLEPTITTDRTNTLGIKELIGRGYSEFAGSIPGRIHNVARAASKLHGVLIKPGEIFSFNEAVGDISAATGYQAAYIIKDGRTVLGDGGGVCQVSSTLFRAALNSGLPITQRQAHAYRVHYYEEGGFKPGLDATVFAPTVDLKIKNDTPGYILIQTKTDTTNLTLTFELYGTKDGRRAEILNHKVWGETPPPPALYQDDPTLPAGVVRQVDFSAWGLRTSFQYKVTRNGEIIQDTVFASNFRPWQAVFLRGTKTP